MFENIISFFWLFCGLLVIKFVEYIVWLIVLSKEVSCCIIFLMKFLSEWVEKILCDVLMIFLRFKCDCLIDKMFWYDCKFDIIIVNSFCVVNFVFDL